MWAVSSDRYIHWDDPTSTDPACPCIRFSLMLEDCNLQQELSRYYQQKFAQLDSGLTQHGAMEADTDALIRAHFDHAWSWCARLDLKFADGDSLRLDAPLIEARDPGKRIDFLRLSRLTWPPLVWFKGRLALEIVPEKFPIHYRLTILSEGDQNRRRVWTAHSRAPLMAEQDGAPVLAYQFAVKADILNPNKSVLRLRVKTQ